MADSQFTSFGQLVHSIVKRSPFSWLDVTEASEISYPELLLRFKGEVAPDEDFMEKLVAGLRTCDRLGKITKASYTKLYKLANVPAPALLPTEQ